MGLGGYAKDPDKQLIRNEIILNNCCDHISVTYR